jgi:hypothetical protein
MADKQIKEMKRNLQHEGYVRFQALTASSMTFRVFWDVVMLKLTDVSEVHTASIIRAMNRPDYKGSMHK